MAEAATDYHHGDQPVAEHAKSYRLFMNLAKWSALHIAVIILVLTLWFCAGMSFFAGLIPGAILSAIGIWFLRAKPAAGH